MTEFQMLAPSIGRESYMHRAAKEVVARWLREAAVEAGGDEYARLSPVSWRVNRGRPHYGIWEEYPFTENGDCPVWDEISEDWQARPPPADWCLQTGHRVICVADIAIQHKGCIKAVVEVVHKHPCSDEKRAFYDNHGIDLFEVPAFWVLEQTKRPAALLTWQMGSTQRDAAYAPRRVWHRR